MDVGPVLGNIGRIAAGVGRFAWAAMTAPTTGTEDDARFEIDIRFVFLRRFAAEAVEVVIRVRSVLGGVIAADLVVSASVGGPQIDIFVAIAL